MISVKEFTRENVIDYIKKAKQRMERFPNTILN